MSIGSTFRMSASRGRDESALRLPPGWPAPGSSLDWIAWNAQGRRSSGQAATLRDLPPEVRIGVVHVWSAAADSLITRVTLPPASRAKMMQALPFALEEQLSDEPDQFHFCVDGSRSSTDGPLNVAITGKQLRQAWIGALAYAGIFPRTLCPVIFAAPWEEGAWTLAWDQHEVWLRTGAASGLCCSGDWSGTKKLVDIALNEARAQQTVPRRLLLVQPPANVNAQELQASFGIAIEVYAGELFAHPSGTTPFNLVADGTASHSDGVRKAIRSLAPALTFFVVWVSIMLASDLVQWAKLRTTDIEQRKEMTALFGSAFPEAKTIVDPALQMERNLAQLQGGRGAGLPSDFLRLLARAAPAIAPNGKVIALRYDKSALQLDVEFATPVEVSSVRSALANRGLKVETIDSKARNGKAVMRMQVSVQGKT